MIARVHHEPDDTEITDLDDEYEMLGEIGRGGSAIVYRARDRSLGREVAIKVVRARFGADDEAIARLAREARTVAQLQHPNIVTVHAVKRLRDDGLALVMQLVPGLTLKALVQQEGALAPERAERILRDVAQALAFAHAHGVVHRDVKPENIFVDAATGRALLSDFGIAHSTEYDSRLTMTGTAIGTPAYMSPEQIDGAPANARSDVYSLGLVAWEMLTGRRPWDGETLYNVIFKQKHDELPAIDELRAGVPPRLQYAVERMLQKRPAARWGGADGLLAFMNAAVLPADWGQWQDAHRRRRAKAKQAGAGAAKVGLVSAALATIRFRRPDASGVPSAVPTASTGTPDASFAPPSAFESTSGFGIPSSASASGASAASAASAADAGAPRAPVVTADVLDDIDDDTPTWAREADELPAARRRRGVVAGAGVLTLAVAGFALFAATRGDERAGDASAARLADRGTVEVPVATGPASTNVPPAAAGASAAASGLLSAADSARLRTLDSLAVDSLLRADARAAAATNTAPVPAAPLPAAPLPAMQSPMGARVAQAHPMRGTTPSQPLQPSPPALRPSSTLPPTSVPMRGSSAGQLARDAAPLPAVAPPNVTAPITTSSGGDANPGNVNPVNATLVRATDERSVIAAGGRHTCVLGSGRVFCWGGNERGQLGDGDTETRDTPDNVVGDLDFVQLAAGIAHSCGVTRGGDAFCWGAGDRGQLGDATMSTRSAPVRVGGNFTYRLVRAGLAHSCGLTSGGDVACWGANTYGQLGDGTITTRSAPVAIASRLRFIAVSTGWNHSCALTADGTAYCWGDNGAGQLGDGSRAGHRTPMPVSSDVRFTSIAAGSSHTCAVSESGEVHCWGRNGFGQLGVSGAVDRATPVKVNTPVRFASVSAGSVHSCARTRGGQAYCWGRNTYGQVGDGSTVDRDAPSRVVGGASFASLNATGAHTCGVTTDGETVCWGYNIDGQLGDGTRNHHARPTRVTIPTSGRN